MQALRTYIETLTAAPLTDADFAPKRLRRYLLQEGEVCKYFTFVAGQP